MSWFIRTSACSSRSDKVSPAKILGLVLLLAYPGCGGEPFDRIRNIDSAGESLICFGDSLTEGVGAPSGADYPSILARALPHPVINAGRAGDTFADGLERLERDVIEKNPRVVIVAFGGNDFLRQVRVDETKRNLEEMVRRIQESGAAVILVGLRLGLFTDEYGPIYQEIARKYRTVYLPDILRGVLSDPKLKSDGVHPNAAGYAVMAERILKEVGPFLLEAEKRKRRR
jgi:lysophospholipase L1-like esterase